RSTPAVRAGSSSVPHRHGHVGPVCLVDGLVVTRVGVENYAHPGVGREHTAGLLGGEFGAIEHDVVVRVERVADADAAAVVDRNDVRARRAVEQGVQDGPVGDRVGVILHGL